MTSSDDGEPMLRPSSQHQVGTPKGMGDAGEGSHEGALQTVNT